MLICFLDKRAQVKPRFVGIEFLIPIVKITAVDAASGEEIDDVHEELFVGVFHIGNNGNFLTICVALDKKFWGILWVVW